MYIKNSIDEKLYSAELYKITHICDQDYPYVTQNDDMSI